MISPTQLRETVSSSIALTTAASLVHSVSERRYSSRFSSTGMSAFQSVKDENRPVGSNFFVGLSSSLSSPSSPSSSSFSKYFEFFVFLRTVEVEGAEGEVEAVEEEGEEKTRPVYPSGKATVSPRIVRPRNAAVICFSSPCVPFELLLAEREEVDSESVSMSTSFASVCWDSAATRVVCESDCDVDGLLLSSGAALVVLLGCLTRK